VLRPLYRNHKRLQRLETQNVTACLIALEVFNSTQKRFRPYEVYEYILDQDE